MVTQIDYWPEAQAVLDQLEADPAKSAVVEAIYRTITSLAADLMDYRLGTKMFKSTGWEGASATPARKDDWWVIWQRGPEPHILDIVTVAQIPL